MNSSPQAEPSWRTGWIEQWCAEPDPLADIDELGHGYDRFACRWEGVGPAGYRMQFGPACVSFEEAEDWCAERCSSVYVDGLDGRWVIGDRTRYAESLTDATRGRLADAPSWMDDAVSWHVVADLSLAVRDYERASIGYSDRLFALRPSAKVRNDVTGARLGAELTIFAPERVCVAGVALWVIRQAASDLPDGLADHGGDVLGGTLIELERS